jgi:hypothetical protein
LSERISLGLLVVGFAALLTTHVFCLVGLAGQRPRSLALWALVVPPLAPFLAHAAGLRWRTRLWVLFAAVYVTGLFLLRR